jgi:hypothetical protein
VKISSLIRSILFAGILSTFPAFAKAAFAGDKLPFDSGTSTLLNQNWDGQYVIGCSVSMCTGGSHSTWGKAIDLNLSGGTNVRAVTAGVVSYAGWADVNTQGQYPTSGYLNGFGYVVWITTPDGKEDIYAHLKQDSIAVKSGDTITQGQLLAKSGNTGWGASGAYHLHWQRKTGGIGGTSVSAAFDEYPNGLPNPGISITSQNSSTQPISQVKVLTSFYVVNNQIRFKSSTDGINFGPETTITGIQTSDQVAAIVFNGKYNVFYKDSSNFINAIYWNGSNWSSPIRLGNTASSTPPVVAIQNGYMNVMFANASGEIRSYYSNNPISWGGPAVITGNYTTKPFSIIIDNSFFNIYYARIGDGKIMRIYNSGNTWSAPIAVENSSTTNATTEGVSAVLDGSYHNVFYKNTNGNINQVYTNNGTWSNPVINSYVGTKKTPKVVNYFGTFKLFILGNNNDNRLYFQSYSNGWQNNSSLFTNDASGLAPEAVVFQQ